MSFAFQQDEPIADGVGRIARHQLDAALALFAPGSRVGRDKAIHETRKRIKRLRALLKLLRGELGSERFRREDHALRDAARPLSTTRDATALRTAFDALLKRSKAAAASAPIKLARAKLAREKHRAAQPAFTALVRALRAARKGTNNWASHKLDWESIASGLRRTYRDGRRDLAAIAKRPKSGALHDWRKRVKDLRHQIELIVPACPEELQRVADDAHALATLLGDDHDLTVLRETLLAGEKAKPFKPLIALVDARRSVLRTQALPLGQRLYEEKPAAFVRRLTCYWAGWCP